MGREEVKISLLADYKLHMENPKVFTKTKTNKQTKKKNPKKPIITNQLNKLNQIPGYKINIQKSVGFPFPTSEVLEREGKTYHLKLCKHVHELA